MRFQCKRAVLLAGVSAPVLLLLVSACVASSSSTPGPPDSTAPYSPPQAEPVTVQGVGNYDSPVFTLQGGSYDVTWRVQQTPMGVNVPCSIDANLYNEAGYYQRNVITETSGPPDAGQVTLRMPQGSWYLEITNSCNDSESDIEIDLVGP